MTETLAHLVGVTVDIVEGNIAEAGTKPWADAQAARFSSLGVDGLLDRWAETAPVIDSLGGVVPDMVASQLVFDAVIHEHDICGALGLPGARTSEPSRWASGSSWPHWPVPWRADRLPRWSSRSKETRT